MSSFKGKRCYTYDELMGMLEESYERGKNKVKVNYLKETEYIKELEKELAEKLSNRTEVEKSLQTAQKQLKINASTELLLLKTLKEQQELLDKITLRLEIYKNKIEDPKLQSEISHISSKITSTIKKSSDEIEKSSDEIKTNKQSNSTEKKSSHLGRNIDKKS